MNKDEQIKHLRGFGERWEAMENDEGIDELMAEHEQFCEDNKLPHICAQELMFELIYEGEDENDVDSGALKEKPKLVIVMEGGMLRAVYSNGGAAGVELVDMDGLEDDGFTSSERDDALTAATNGLHPIF